MTDFVVCHGGPDGIHEVYGTFTESEALTLYCTKADAAEEALTLWEEYDVLTCKLAARYFEGADTVEKRVKAWKGCKADPELIAWEEKNGKKDRWDEPDYWSVCILTREGMTPVRVCREHGIRMKFTDVKEMTGCHICDSSP